jgi:hypothetical protein
LTSDGHTEVATATGPWRSARGGQTVPAGGRVRVTSGTAQVYLVPDGLLELRSGSQLRLDATPSLQAGDVLIEPNTHPLRVASGPATVDVSTGAARLHHGADTTLTVYRGSAQLDGIRQLNVKAPRQSAVPAGSAQANSPAPVSYHPDDQWDQRYLAGIESFGHQLTEAATGFDAQIRPGTSATAAFYEQLLPELVAHPDFKIAFDEETSWPTPNAPAGSMARARTVGGYLVASAIALRGQTGTVGQRLAEELTFADQGADWGLVAFDQGVGDFRLVGSDLLVAIGRAPLQFTLPGALQIAASGRPATLPLGDGQFAQSPTTALLNLIAAGSGPTPFVLSGSVPGLLMVAGTTSGTIGFIPSPGGQSPTPGTTGGTVSGPVQPATGSTGRTFTGPGAPSVGSSGGLTGPALPPAVTDGSATIQAPGSGLLDPLLNPVSYGVSALTHLAGGLLPGLLPPKAPAPGSSPAGAVTSPSSGAGAGTPVAGITSSTTGASVPSNAVVPAPSGSSPQTTLVPSSSRTGPTTSGAPTAGSSVPSAGSRATPGGPAVTGAITAATSATTTTAGGKIPPNTGQTN